jgi:hypothetical protein
MNSRMALGITLVAALLFLPAKRVRAQVLPAAAGATGGFLAGTFVTMGIVVVEARMGHYMYGLDDLVGLRPEIIPILVLPVAGAWIGAKSPETLRRAGLGALIGVASGAAIGTGVGALVGSSPEENWSGGIIGGAVGLLAGSVIMATRSPRSDNGNSVPLASMSIKVPWGR